MPAARKKALVSVIIPALDEERTIGRVVSSVGKSLAGERVEIIVVDSSSGDGTARAARKAGARVVREHKLGYGLAYLTGFSAARGETIVMVDADGTYPSEDIHILLQAFRSTGADVLVGSRFLGTMRAGAMGPILRFGNRLITLATNIFFGTRLTDSQSGLRILSREAVRRMAPRAEGMEFASELNVLCAREKLRVVEIPIDYRQREGVSKLKPLRDGFRHFAFLLKVRLGC